ncbi:MAG TPA: hypothetical protein VFJ74_04310 [Gemmatimonadaceae bacterium]|nr:hypothetical protein [Gemmatimonadaceae bacterium]
MPNSTSSTVRPAATRTGRRRRVAVVAALGLLAAAACSGRERSRTVDADLGHDLDLASTTGIELANRARGGTQVVSAIEEGPRSALQRSASAAKASGRRRHKVAKPKIAAPPATVMVADHEAAAAASTEQAAGEEPVSTAPAPAPDPGPAVVPEPVSYPAGGAAEPGRGTGIGTVIGGVIGVVLRGGMGGVDRCDERHTHGRRGGNGGIDGIPLPIPGGANPRWPAGSTTFPRY